MSSPQKIAYFEKQQVEPLLIEALKAASQAEADDAVEFIGHYMLQKSPNYVARTHAAAAGGGGGNGGSGNGEGGEGSGAGAADGGGDGGGHGGGVPDEAALYVSQTAFGVAGQRTKWLLGFLFGLLACASVMHEFEALLAREIELAFFVPLLIGHGGNSGGQTVSTVIRALGSGALSLSDGPRVVLKEAAAGLMQGTVLVGALAPTLLYGMGITSKVTAIVCLALPCLGTIANTIGAALPFVVTWCGADPAVIVGPLMTTSVDSLGLMTYMFIATVRRPCLASPPAPAPAAAARRPSPVPAHTDTAHPCKISAPPPLHPRCPHPLPRGARPARQSTAQPSLSRS